MVTWDGLDTFNPYLLVTHFLAGYVHLYRVSGYLASVVVGCFLAWAWGRKILPHLLEDREVGEFPVPAFSLLVLVLLAIPLYVCAAEERCPEPGDPPTPAELLPAVRQGFAQQTLPTGVTKQAVVEATSVGKPTIGHLLDRDKKPFGPLVVCWPVSVRMERTTRTLTTLEPVRFKEPAEPRRAGELPGGPQIELPEFKEATDQQDTICYAVKNRDGTWEVTFAPPRRTTKCWRW
jgi:hypothetical protein